MRTLWIMLVVSMAVAAQTVENRTEGAGLFTLEADYCSMGDALARIHGPAVRVCFEDRDFDKDTDRISATDRVAELERVAEVRELTAREAMLLGFARQRVRDGKPADAPYDINHYRISGKFACATVEELLGELTQGSPYTWEKCSKTYVVFPRAKSVLDFPVTVQAARQTLDSVTGKMLDSAPGGRSISRATIILGPLPAQPGKRIVQDLRLEGVRCRDALCRAVESVGDDVVWTVAGLKGSRALYLNVTRGSADGPTR